MIRIDKNNRLPASRLGFSYVEVLMATLIITVLLIAAVRLFGNLGRSRTESVDAHFAARLAVDMISEIKQKAYCDPGDPNDDAIGPTASELGPTRTLFDDIDDYHQWSACPPIDRDGLPLSRYANYTRSVSVRLVAGNDFTQAASQDEGFKEVTISVNRGDKTLAQQKYVIAQTAPQDSP